MDKVLVPLLLVAVGALLGGVINAAVSRYSAFKESKGVAAALRAEMAALLKLVELRGYEPALDAIISRLKGSAYAPSAADIFGIQATQEYFAVFNSNTGKLGTLGVDLSGRVVHAYVLAKGLVEDFRGLLEFQEKVLGQVQPVALDREWLLENATRLRRLLDVITREGKAVVVELDRFQERTWLLVFR